MPITQSRMISLLRAAQDYQDALARLSNSIAQQQQQVALKRRTPEQAWELIAASANPLILLSDPIQSSEVILAEAIHFKSKQASNAKKALKMRENRELAYFGVKTNRPTTAPRQRTRPGRLDAPVEPRFPGVKMLSESTDQNQIQTDTELDFAPPVTQDTVAEVDKFLAEQEVKQDYTDRYGITAGANKINNG